MDVLRFSWIAELLGLLGLLGSLEGVFGFLALLEGGLLQRRSGTPDAQERSAEYYHYYHLQACRFERKMGDGWLLLAGMADWARTLSTLGEVGG